jgi:hypothetical protein
MTARLPRIEAGSIAWESIAPLGELVDARHGGVTRDRTLVRAATSGHALHVLFECADRDVWGTLGRRDDPLWKEEVVEVFIAPGRDDPRRYVEIELSPAGVLFDAIVDNPDGRRDTMTVNAAWNAAGLVSRVSRPRTDLWRAELSIPWVSLAPDAARQDAWRANFFRVERPHAGSSEFSAWSPTGADPADFHKPACFGLLVAA